MKKFYFYLFYKLYKFSEAAPSRWWSDWKASLMIDVLILFVFVSIVFYSGVNINMDNSTNRFVFFLFLLIISLSNTLIFNLNDSWKQYNKMFDKLPPKKNKIGGVFVWSLIFLIILNLIFSFYIMDLRAKKNNTGPYSKKIENLNN